MPPTWITHIAAYFDSAASDYPSAIEPALGPLAEGVVEHARLRSGECVLDLGTGTGLAARAAANQAGEVVGLDISRRMLAAARPPLSWHPAQGDMHYLPFPAGRFDVVLASFALNSTDPRRALVEARRVLKPGGRLVIQEWDAQDELSEIIADTVAAYATEEPPPALLTLRQQMEAPIPWDSIQSTEELTHLIEQAGFSQVQVCQAIANVRLPDMEALLRYKLAWPIRRAEISAMPPEVRALCLSDLQENLAAHTDADGAITWRPGVIRIRALKPAH